MRETFKITADHLRRAAFVYVRQSSTSQVEHNRESTDRQYKLVDRAVDLGWARDHVTIIDDDLGVSGAPMRTIHRRHRPRAQALATTATERVGRAHP